MDFPLVVSFLGVACFCGVPSRARAISRVCRNRRSMRPLSCHLYHSPPAKVNSGPANFHFDAPLPPKNATSSDPSTSAVYPGVSISRTLRGPRLADKLGHTTPNLPLLAVSREPNLSAPKKHPNKVRQRKLWQATAVLLLSRRDSRQQDQEISSKSSAAQVTTRKHAGGDDAADWRRTRIHQSWLMVCSDFASFPSS